MRIVTHNAKFHTDDVFGVAALLLLYPEAEVLRTRDEELIASADIVLDVGNVYDPEKNRFDHHQIGGAGERENGIPYASIGLVWKKFGEQVSGSASVADEIDRTLIQSMDALDNGKDIYKPLISGVYSFNISSMVNQYRNTWKEAENWDGRFMEAVSWAQTILKRQIKMTQDYEEGRRIVLEAYEKSGDKRLVMIDEQYDLGREMVQGVLSEFSEPLYGILFRADVGNWQVVAVRKPDTFELRQPLPEAWAGKRDGELEEVTGVPGAIFCHRGRFMSIVQSKEAALELARLALEAKNG